ncbi:MAG: glycosyltransferase family 2 protein [Wenzhouxiangella sp.]
MNPKVTVYIPSRNYGRFLREAVESVFAQSMREWELIIFDEGSDDQTAVLAREFLARAPDRVRVVTHDRPMGLRHCANKALEMARGEYIIRLDADDYFDESALLILSRYLDEHSNVGLVYPNWIYVTEFGDVIGVEQRKKVNDEAEVLDLPAHGACTLIRKRVLKAVGGYDTEFESQDGHELWLKALHRFKVGNVQTPLFFYRKHAGSMSSNIDGLLEARRKIKKKVAGAYSGPVKPRIAAVIPVKNTYEHMPNIALEPLAGRPLIDYTLECAQGCSAFDLIFVTTDDKSVAQHCKDMANVATHLRDMSLSDPEVQLQTVIQDAIDHMESETGFYPDIVAILNVHAPLRQVDHVQEALDTLLVYEVDQVISTYEDTDLHFRHGRNGLEPLNFGATKALRLEREALFAWNGAVHVLWRDVLRTETLYSGRIGHIIMPRIESVQVKYPEARQRVENIMRERNDPRLRPRPARPKTAKAARKQ